MRVGTMAAGTRAYLAMCVPVFSLCQPCGWLHLNEWVMSSACDKATETSTTEFQRHCLFLDSLRLKSQLFAAYAHTSFAVLYLSHAHILAAAIIYYASLSGAVSRTEGLKTPSNLTDADTLLKDEYLVICQLSIFHAQIARALPNPTWQTHN